MAENDGCDYVLVVQQGALKKSPQREEEEEKEGQRRDEEDGIQKGEAQPGGEARQQAGQDIGRPSPHAGEEATPTWSPSLLWDRYQEEEGEEGSGVSSGRQPLDLDDLPLLPRNARYVMHANECYDWGTFGWLLATMQV